MTAASPHPVTLAYLRERYGDRCQISQDSHTGVYVSVERPSVTAQSVIVGRTLEEFTKKLADEYGPAPERKPKARPSEMLPPRESDLLLPPVHGMLADARQDLRRIPPQLPSPFGGEGSEAG